MGASRRDLHGIQHGSHSTSCTSTTTRCSAPCLQVFSYYASLTTDGDKFSISLNSYHKLYVDCGLSVPNSVACQKRHLDQLFVAVNTIGKGSGRAERHNRARQLNRQEHSP